MCNDEALNVVICSMNANIHVVVHKDLHEINLLNVNRPGPLSTVHRVTKVLAPCPLFDILLNKYFPAG
jgi:hypothetical protein